MAQIDRSRHDLPRRHYTVQIHKSKNPRPSEDKEDKTAAQRPGRFGKLLSTLFVLVIIAGLALVLWRVTHKPKDPLPTTIKKSVAFQLYYPAAKPDGYSLDPASIVNSNGTIFYNLVKNPGDPPIVVSQQPIPKGFDPKTMFQHSPLPSTISPLGTIYDLSYKNQSRFMVVANNSLIFISSASKISNSQLQQVVEGLKQSK